MLFADRREAGRILAGLLTKYADRHDVLVLALPRGGVPVAFEVAHALTAPLDVFIVRKLGVPGHDELAMGAIATGGVRVVNEDVVVPLGLSASSYFDCIRIFPSRPTAGMLACLKMRMESAPRLK